MDSFERLIHRAVSNGHRFVVSHDPSERNEEWGIKYYPEADSEGHYYAYASSKEDAARRLLDELRGVFG